MEKKITELELLAVFRQCSHLQYRCGAPGCPSSRGRPRLLTLLLDRGEMTQRELCDATQRRAATLSEQLALMESDGLITRAENGEDRRSVRVALTAAGLAAAEEAKTERAREAQALFSFLDDGERKKLMDMLLTLRGRWLDLAAQAEDDA